MFAQKLYHSAVISVNEKGSARAVIDASFFN
jgi:hypothetical protein